MLQIQKSSPEAGITLMPGIEYLEAPSPAYKELTEGKASSMGLAGFRLLKPDEFPDSKVQLGFTYDTWCVNPMVYCSFLLRRFGHRGGKVLRRRVRDPAELFVSKELGSVDVVINCSGNGFNDENMFITRGKHHRDPSETHAFVLRGDDGCRPNMSSGQLLPCDSDTSECGRVVGLLCSSQL